jgi:hypothetical protein
MLILIDRITLINQYIYGIVMIISQLFRNFDMICKTN